MRVGFHQAWSESQCGQYLWDILLSHTLDAMKHITDDICNTVQLLRFSRLPFS